MSLGNAVYQVVSVGATSAAPRYPTPLPSDTLTRLSFFRENTIVIIIYIIIKRGIRIPGVPNTARVRRDEIAAHGSEIRSDLVR